MFSFWYFEFRLFSLVHVSVNQCVPKLFKPQSFKFEAATFVIIANIVMLISITRLNIEGIDPQRLGVSSTKKGQRFTSF